MTDSFIALVQELAAKGCPARLASTVNECNRLLTNDPALVFSETKPTEFSAVVPEKRACGFATIRGSCRASSRQKRPCRFRTQRTA
jgi:hypothetical protein